MIYFNQYSVRITPGREASDGYVIMKHGDVYTITLRNAHSTRCDAEIFIAGKSAGKWRVDAYKSITLERPAHDEGMFTFYQIGTPEFSAIGGQNVSRDLQGLIEVVFTPEKFQPVSNFNNANTVYRSGTSVDNARITLTSAYTADSSGVAMASSGDYGARTLNVISSNMSSMVAGETGLSGHSNQIFNEVPELNYDFDNQVKIRVGLVIDTGGPRPLVSRSNPIPPPV